MATPAGSVRHGLTGYGHAHADGDGSPGTGTVTGAGCAEAMDFSGAELPEDTRDEDCTSYTWGGQA